MKKLSKRKKHLKTILSNHILLEDNQHLLQKSSKKINSNIITLALYSTYGKANNQVFCKAEIRISSKKHYKAC